VEASNAAITRHGFLWRAHYWTDHTHPQGYGYGGYYKFVRAWTKFGALRLAENFRHQRWGMDVSRV
jgi:hypothetical protein